MLEKRDFIDECLRALTESEPQQAVKELVARTVADKRGLEAVFGVPSKAGIETVYRSDGLTILNVIWAPLMTLYPHDHGTWAVLGIYGGQEDNAFYRRRPQGQGLDQVNGRSLAEGESITLGERVIHSVANPRRSYTGAIHVYGADFFAVPRQE